MKNNINFQPIHHKVPSINSFLPPADYSRHLKTSMESATIIIRNN